MRISRSPATLPRVLRSQRTLLALLTVLAVALAAAQALTGMAELALYFAPLLVMGGLLLSGRFLGETHAVARLVRTRATARLRPRRSLPRPGLLDVPVGQLFRSVRLLRGPPALLVPAA